MRVRSSLLAIALLALIPVPAGAMPAAAAPVVKPAPAVPTAPPPTRLRDVTSYGNARNVGSTTMVSGNHPIVGIARTASDHGYWEAAIDGGVFAFGDARFYGSMGGKHLNQPIVGIAATPSGKGYWLVANDGGIFTFGDARFYGSTGNIHLNQPIVGIAATPSGKGYWLAASDGGIFTFGNARFRGSMGGTPLHRPVVAIAASAVGSGYYLVASDGGVFTFGNARFRGARPNDVFPVVGIAVRPDNNGYWIVDYEGNVEQFGQAELFGDARNRDATKPIVGIVATKTGKGYWLVGRGTQPVYFLRGEHVGVANRDVHQGVGPDAAINVMRDLFAGPTAAERAAGLATAIPAGAAVLDVTVAHRLATVEVSPSYAAGGGSLSMQERVAQVVFTLTGMPGIDRVAFSMNGKHVSTIGGEGLMVDPPPDRNTFASFLPQVLIITPGPGDLVTSPLVVTGQIDAFEGTGTLALNAADGRLLAGGIGTGAMGFSLAFGTALGFQPGTAATGTLVARPSSGIETLPPPDAVIPVRFR